MNERVLILIEQADFPADCLTRHPVIVFHAVHVALSPNGIRSGGIGITITRAPY